MDAWSSHCIPTSENSNDSGSYSCFTWLHGALHFGNRYFRHRYRGSPAPEVKAHCVFQQATLPKDVTGFDLRSWIACHHLYGAKMASLFARAQLHYHDRPSKLKRADVTGYSDTRTVALLGQASWVWLYHTIQTWWDKCGCGCFIEGPGATLSNAFIGTSLHLHGTTNNPSIQPKHSN